MNNVLHSFSPVHFVVHQDHVHNLIKHNGEFVKYLILLSRDSVMIRTSFTFFFAPPLVNPIFGRVFGHLLQKQIKCLGKRSKIKMQYANACRNSSSYFGWTCVVFVASGRFYRYLNILRAKTPILDFVTIINFHFKSRELFEQQQKNKWNIPVLMANIWCWCFNGRLASTPLCHHH